MKQLAITVAILLITFTTAFAGERKETFNFKENRQITVVDKGDFLEITTANNTIRVYPCGEVDKLTWKELTPNEDTHIRSWSWSLPTQNPQPITITPAYINTQVGGGQ